MLILLLAKFYYIKYNIILKILYTSNIICKRGRVDVTTPDPPSCIQIKDKKVSDVIVKCYK